MQEHMFSWEALQTTPINEGGTLPHLEMRSDT